MLLRANEVVPSERILEELFRDAARDPANALQVAISRLRRSLADGVLETRPRGYLLHAGPDELDSVRFERLADEGRRQLAAGDAEAAAATLAAALELWRGSPLQEVALLEFAQPEIRRLEELRLTARMDRIDAELALGRADELVPELEALAAANPLQERLHGQLMLALYRAGRQADALEVYRQTRELLREELGLEPSRALQRLERVDPEPGRRARARRRAGGRRATPASARSRGSPPYDGDDAEFFFGRERAVAELVARLAAAPFVAIVGASGSGKSSLAPRRAPAGAPRRRTAGERGVAAAAPPARRADRSGRARGRGRPARGGVRRAEASVRFFDALVAATAHARVVVCLRADFYGRCAEHRGLAELVSRSQMLVGPMEPDELRRAIEAPAARAGLEVEPPLVDALVAEVEGQPGALPLLSTTLLELWRLRGGGVLRLRDLPRGRRRRRRGRAARRADVRAARRRRARGGASGSCSGSPTRARTRPCGGASRLRNSATTPWWRRSPTRGSSPSATGSPRSRTRRSSAIGRACATGSRRTRRGAPPPRARRRRPRGGTRAAATSADLYRGARLAAAVEWADAHPGDANGTSARSSPRRGVRRSARFAGCAGRCRARGAARGRDRRGRGRARPAAVGAPRRARARSPRGSARRRSPSRASTARSCSRARPSGSTTRPRHEQELLATLLRSPALLASYDLPDGTRPYRVAVSPDGRTLFVGDSDGALRLFDTRTRGRDATAAAERVRLPAGRVHARRDEARRGREPAARAGGARRADAAPAPAAAARPPLRPDTAGAVAPLEVTPRAAFFAYDLVIDPQGDEGPAFLDRLDLATGRRTTVRLGAPDVVGAGLVHGDLVTVTSRLIETWDPRTLRRLRAVHVPIRLGGYAAVDPTGRYVIGHRALRERDRFRRPPHRARDSCDRP